MASKTAFCKAFVDESGVLKFRHEKLRIEYEAVRYQDIRQDLIADASAMAPSQNFSTSGNPSLHEGPAVGSSSRLSQDEEIRDGDNDITAYHPSYINIKIYNRNTWPEVLTQYLPPDPKDQTRPVRKLWRVNGKLVLNKEDEPMFYLEHLPVAISKDVEACLLEVFYRIDPELSWADIVARMPSSVDDKIRHNVSMKVTRFRETQGLLTWNPNHESWIQKAFFDLRMTDEAKRANSVKALRPLASWELGELKIAKRVSMPGKWKNEREPAKAGQEARDAKVEKKVKNITAFRNYHKREPRLLTSDMDLLNAERPSFLPSNVSAVTYDTEGYDYLTVGKRSNQYEGALKDALVKKRFHDQQISITNTIFSQKLPSSEDIQRDRTLLASEETFPNANNLNQYSTELLSTVPYRVGIEPPVFAQSSSIQSFTSHYEMGSSSSYGYDAHMGTFDQGAMYGEWSNDTHTPIDLDGFGALDMEWDQTTYHQGYSDQQLQHHHGRIEDDENAEVERKRRRVASSDQSWGTYLSEMNHLIYPGPPTPDFYDTSGMKSSGELEKETFETDRAMPFDFHSIPNFQGATLHRSSPLPSPGIEGSDFKGRVLENVPVMHQNYVEQVWKLLDQQRFDEALEYHDGNHQV